MNAICGVLSHRRPDLSVGDFVWCPDSQCRDTDRRTRGHVNILLVKSGRRLSCSATAAPSHEACRRGHHGRQHPSPRYPERGVTSL